MTGKSGKFALSAQGHALVFSRLHSTGQAPASQAKRVIHGVQDAHATTREEMRQSRRRLLNATIVIGKRRRRRRPLDRHRSDPVDLCNKRDAVRHVEFVFAPAPDADVIDAAFRAFGEGRRYAKRKRRVISPNPRLPAKSDLITHFSLSLTKIRNFIFTWVGLQI